MQNRIHESVARLVMKSEDFEVLDGLCRGLLGARHVTQEPRRAAARAMSYFCSGVTRASRRSAFSARRTVFAVLLVSPLILTSYGG